MSRDVGHVFSQSWVNCERIVRCGAIRQAEAAPRGITIRFWPWILVVGDLHWTRRLVSIGVPVARPRSQVGDSLTK